MVSVKPRYESQGPEIHVVLHNFVSGHSAAATLVFQTFLLLDGVGVLSRCVGSLVIVVQVACGLYHCFS